MFRHSPVAVDRRRSRREAEVRNRRCPSPLPQLRPGDGRDGLVLQRNERYRGNGVGGDWHAPREEMGRGRCEAAHVLPGQRFPHLLVQRDRLPGSTGRAGPAEG